MKEILLSIISPLKMKKFRFMSVLVSMLIFIVSIYAISLPNKVYMKNNKDWYLEQKAYVNVYLNLPELEKDINGNKITDGQFKVNDKYEMTSVYKNEIKQYHFEDIDVQLIGEESKTVDLHIVFDVDDKLTSDLNKIREDYKNLYPEDSDKKMNYSSYIYYVDHLNGKETTLEQLHNVEEKELEEQMKNINNYDLFGIKTSGDDYLLIFLKNSIVSQIPYYDKSTENTTYPALSSVYSVSKMNLDFSDKTTLKEFGKYLADMMFEPLSDTDQTEYLLQVLGYVLIFPAIFVLLLCWSMKKRGVMKTYKEYYNVASIASILPLLITFILAWFIPKVAPIYGALFCAFTLFVFIKINSTPELTD